MKRIAYRGYAVSRDAIEAEIVAALEKVGATVQRLDVPCDLLIGFRLSTFLMEIKGPKESLTDAQRNFWRNWNGGPVHIVHDVREALLAIGAIK